MHCRHWLLFVALGLTGCGEASPGGGKALDMGGPDANAVTLLVEELNESKGSSKKMADAFAKGAAPPPADAKRFNQYSLSVVGKPAVTGATATARVSLVLEKTGAEASQMDWTFEKVGDQWKIKSAPLPAGR